MRWIGFFLAAIFGFALVLLFSPLLICYYFVTRHYSRKILHGMPVGTWVTFDTILKLGVPRNHALNAVIAYMVAGILSAQVRKDLDEQRRKEMETCGTSFGYRRVTDMLKQIDDPQVFHFSHPHFYEYMLHKRPRGGGEPVGLNRWQRRRAAKIAPARA